MADQRIKRHVYLPGLAAFDTGHRKAAVMEMGHTGANNEFKPGTVFVDNIEAQRAVRAHYEERHASVMDKLLAGNLTIPQKQQLQREYRGLSSAIRNVRVVQPGMAPYNNRENGPADVLFVKGHGSPRNPNSITTVATPVDEDEHHPPGLFEQATKVNIKRGYKMTHTAQDIGTAVHNIANSVNSPGLDVRLTSCGSAGTVSRDHVAIGPRNLAQTFAGQVSATLDAQHADPRVRVSGFQGDSNSTLPSRQGADDGFVTKIKEKPENPNNLHHFVDAMERQTAKLGPLHEALEPIKQPLREVAVATRLKANLPMPPIASLGVAPAMHANMRPFTKIVTTDNVNTQRVATGTRTAALTPIDRH
ncbi:hypothetical protein [Polaromonas sp. P5_D5]|jgi:hypothetical protein